MAAHIARECRLLPLERKMFRRVGYMRVRRNVAGAAQKAFVNWLRERFVRKIGPEERDEQPRKLGQRQRTIRTGTPKQEHRFSAVRSY
jgi:hypothetical protein